MKKIVLTLAVILGLGCGQMQAQTISGGIKAELNMSNYLLSDFQATTSTMKAGPTLGGFMTIQFSENFALQPEALFHFRQSKMEVGRLEQDWEYWGMEIPIYAVGQMQLGAGKGYLGFGPYFGLGFDAQNTTFDLDLYEKNSVTDKATLKRFDFGLGIMVGYEFNAGVSINAGYKIGLLDMMDAGRDNASMLPQVVSLGVGYRF